jgi:phosphoglycolate phosphatase
MLEQTAPDNLHLSESISPMATFPVLNITPPARERRHHDKPLLGITFCFDLDGTLVDTAPDLVRVTDYVIAMEGLPPTNFASARKDVGYGSRALIYNACRRAGYTLDEERFLVLQKIFLEHYAETICEKSILFPGVYETLKSLKKAGAALNVCTNKPGYLARPLIKELGLSFLFNRIIGGDEVPFSKPHQSHVFMAAGVPNRSKTIIMVGDSYPDIRSGHNAGVPTILMRYGYSTIKPHKLRPTIALDHFREIPHVIGLL